VKSLARECVREKGAIDGTAHITVYLRWRTVAFPPNRVAGQQMQGCQDHAQMVVHLKTKFHEERAEVGVNQYGRPWWLDSSNSQRTNRAHHMNTAPS
jgi:hypothetical protein